MKLNHYEVGLLQINKCSDNSKRLEVNIGKMFDDRGREGDNNTHNIEIIKYWVK
jgi:hypothetical protein